MTFVEVCRILSIQASAGAVGEPNPPLDSIDYFFTHHSSTRKWASAAVRSDATNVGAIRDYHGVVREIQHRNILDEISCISL